MSSKSPLVLRTVYVTVAMDQMLRRIAYERGSSKNDVIRELLERGLRRMRSGYDAPKDGHDYNCALNDPTPIIAGESPKMAALDRAMRRCTCGRADGGSNEG